MNPQAPKEFSMSRSNEEAELKAEIAQVKNELAQEKQQIGVTRHQKKLIEAWKISHGEDAPIPIATQGGQSVWLNRKMRRRLSKLHRD